MPSLKIGRAESRLPIIQGGMAVRVSLSPLAVAVAEAGGIGVIAGSGLAVDELREQVARARASTSGVIGVNIMVAVTGFKELVHAALEAGADLIISGAGFSREVFAWCREAGTAFVPIVGSARAAALSQKFGADAVIVEGVEAGGHLGTDRSVWELLPEILEAVDVPVIAAGGIADGRDIHRALCSGAAGVQMGSRFAATIESSAPDGFKQMYVEAGENDIVLVKSPVGLPGRALRNPFTEALARGDVPRIESCIVCLKKCGREYCIMDELVRAQEGDVERGLVFAGQAAVAVHDIPSAGELMQRLEREWAEADEESRS
jgi:NAD(P)H-dependent flavin oxidoreductase YrpB (nitropropane dioxygenase family)